MDDWESARGQDKRRPRSNWWFLLPILLSVIGGVIAYFALRGDDNQKAKNCLYLGIALTAASIAINLALAATFAGVMDSMDLGVSP